MKYKRIMLTRAGGPHYLEMVEEDLRAPMAGMVRIRMEAAGVSFHDVMLYAVQSTIFRRLILGAPAMPFTPGADVVGVIDAVGAGVDNALAGRRVAALVHFGGYAEYVYVAAKEVVMVPEAVDSAEAVSLVLNYVTAYQILHRTAEVTLGESILVHGAGGGVGTALVQLSHLAGLTVYGTVAPDQIEAVERAGVETIDYTSQDFVERMFALRASGVDVVTDHVGGWHLWQSYRVLRPRGRIITFGTHLMDRKGRLDALLGVGIIMWVNMLPNQRRVKLYILNRTKKYSHPRWFKDDLSRLLSLLSRREIAPIVAAKVPLHEVRQAHDRLRSGKIQGKLILIPS